MENYILHKDYVPRNAYADIAVVFLKPGEGEFLLKEQSMFSPNKCDHQIYQYFSLLKFSKHKKYFFDIESFTFLTFCINCTRNQTLRVWI